MSDRAALLDVCFEALRAQLPDAVDAEALETECARCTRGLGRL